MMYPSLYMTQRFLRTPRLKDEFRFLQETQWLKPEKIMDIQKKRLKLLLSHAYQNVPYYHALFKERGLHLGDFKAIDDLNKIPVLRKEDIRNNFDKITATDLPRHKMIPLATGGSTGAPLRFYVTEEYTAAGSAAELRAYGWSGYKLGDKYALIWGSSFDLRESGKLRERVTNFFKRCLILNSFQMNEESMKTFADKLRRFRPKIIRGYASALYLFARFLRREGITSIRPDAVISAAETLFRHERQTMEESFGCEVYDFYGTREAAAISSECSKHHGYHITAENYVVECAKDGEFVAPNERGAIIVTNLRNYAMPFIRYEIGDLGKLSDDTCPCGRNLPLMQTIEGRVTDVIVTSDGRYVPGEFFPHLFKDVEKSVKEFQVVQETINQLILNLVRGPSYQKKDINYVMTNVKKFIGEDMEIEVNFVDSIIPTSSGKRRPVISKVPLKL